MFDVSFTELLLIGIIALIVIGPERLPGVARTIGHLVGRAQRYVNDVKADIQREVDLGDISNLKEQMTEAANSVKTSLESATQELRKPLQDAQDAFKDASDSVSGLVAEAKTSAQEAADSLKQAAAPAQIADTAQPAVPAPAAAHAEPGAVPAPAATPAAEANTAAHVEPAAAPFAEPGIAMPARAASVQPSHAAADTVQSTAAPSTTNPAGGEAAPETPISSVEPRQPAPAGTPK
jgi:sec-independent protein translocase protein TatB